MANQFSSVAKAEDMHIDTATITWENSVATCNPSSHMLSIVAVAHKDAVHVTKEVLVLLSSAPWLKSKIHVIDRDKIPVITDIFPTLTISGWLIFKY